MNVSEIRVKLVKNSKERLKAVCSVTFDSEFVIRDLKVIEGTSGLFVAMPSRKLADHCPKCRAKNHLRARYCNECGQTLDDRRADRVRGGRARLHADIAHPINSQCRNRIQHEVVEAYHGEVDRSQQPGYRPVDYDDLDAHSETEPHANSGSKSDGHSDGHSDGQTDGQTDGDSGSDYADLIAELKQDARQRRPDRSSRDERDAPIHVAPDGAEESPDPVEVRDERPDTPDDVRPKPESPAPTIPDDDFGAGIL